MRTIQTNVQDTNGSKPATKERILDAAERLFAEVGFESTSLRMITSKAGVNLAAVNYHFHSKEDLVRAVFARRIRPLNAARLEGLRRHLDSVGDGRPNLEEVIRAFVEPVVMLKGDPSGAAVGRLFGRTYSEPSEAVRRPFFELMREVGRPFTEAFRRALPDLPQVDLLWKTHFAVGVVAHTLAGAEHLKVISGGLCDPSDVEGVVGRIVAFIAAGMRSSAAQPHRSQ